MDLIGVVSAIGPFQRHGGGSQRIHGENEIAWKESDHSVTSERSFWISGWYLSSAIERRNVGHKAAASPTCKVVALCNAAIFVLPCFLVQVQIEHFQMAWNSFDLSAEFRSILEDTS